MKVGRGSGRGRGRNGQESRHVDAEGWMTECRGKRATSEWKDWDQENGRVEGKGKRGRG